ncbi:MAG: Rieske 2Fe-2S domain-containing protein, partial [Candidatus Dormibacteraeota bacterium]|nr:Rieske 2Fe-2S domain-containing protein [Candidatus Dormibacteraeota bacterium]
EGLMLNEKDNELLTRVGPGTPMGELFRRFWIPALTSRELHRDGERKRLRILGENLVAFRDTNGEVGILQSLCPHRRAPLYWGRNEECGLRCVYHGWKFDVKGRCVDMPSEPPESTFKEKVSAMSYPAKDHGGFIWVYMGPRDRPELTPQLPKYEWTQLPEENLWPNRGALEANWLQILEGDIDTSHVSHLHRRFDVKSAPPPQFISRYREYVAMDGAPRLTVKETPGGFVYGGRRTVGDGEYYWRLTHWLAPYTSQIPGNRSGQAVMRIPMDDENTYSCGILYSLDRPLSGPDDPLVGGRGQQQGGTQQVILRDGYVVDCPRSAQNRENNYGFDLERQRTTNYSGIAGGPAAEDRAMTEGMGPILDRSEEHLGTSDVAIIAARRCLLRMARELQEGREPHATQHPEDFATTAIDVESRHADFDDVLAENASVLGRAIELVSP